MPTDSSVDTTTASDLKQLEAGGTDEAVERAVERAFGELRADDVVEHGFVEYSPKQDGRNMTMIIAPLKNKSDAKAEAAKAKAPGSEAETAPETPADAE